MQRQAMPVGRRGRHAIAGHQRQPLRLVLLLALVAAVLGCAGLRDPYQARRIVAIGDVHGSIEGLVTMLQRARLIDADRRWIGADAVLVQVGDTIDRGPADLEVLDLLMALEEQAPAQGGRVIVLLGNHEVMNLHGDLRYVSAATYRSFATPDSEQSRARAYADVVRLQRDRALERGDPPPTAGPETRAQWMEAHPPGFLEHRDAFGPEGRYGRWLRARPALVQIGEVLFVHGGVHPELAARGVRGLNEQIHTELAFFDTLHTELVGEKRILPFAGADAMIEVARAELAPLRSALATQAVPDAADERRAHFLEQLTQYDSWTIVHPKGPLWFRGFADWTDEEVAAWLPGMMITLGVKHFVSGHTPQIGAGIRMRAEGGIFLIDTGMLGGESYAGGEPSALEIQYGRFTALYPDREELLLGVDEVARAASSPLP